jgi:diguanylate cyclase (GGDEF)-like protein/PAS domain S-box-containing protein
MAMDQGSAIAEPISARGVPGVSGGKAPDSRTPCSPEFYRVLLDHVAEGVYFVDRDRRITYWGRAAEKLTGYSASEVVGRHCSDNLLMHVDDHGNQLCLGACPLSGAMADRKAYTAEVYLRHRAGHRVRVLVRTAPAVDARDNVLGAVEVFSDMSAQKEAEARLRELEAMAFLDPLTRVASRHYLQTVLSRMLSDVRRYGQNFGLLLFDVDHFKSVNDCFGHGVGDTVLAAVAKSMAGNLRTSDVLGRWGGEEFLALMPHIDRGQLTSAAERCRALVEASCVACAGSRVSVTVSCGGTMVETGDSQESALGRADQFLYRSKHGGRNRVTIGFLPGAV